MNKKFDNEDRNIVILIIIFLLLLSSIFIYKLLNPIVSNTNNEEVFMEYELLNESGYFKSYEINESIIDDFNIFVNDVNVKLNNKELTIDDQLIKNNVEISPKIAFYDYILVIYANDLKEGKSIIIEYNKMKRESKIVDKIEDMNLYDINDAGMAEAGLNLYLTRRFNDKVIVKDKEYDICSYKDNKLIESMNIMLFYNVDTESFDQSDIITKRYISEVKKDIC
jgi:hypothetical protein